MGSMGNGFINKSRLNEKIKEFELQCNPEAKKDLCDRLEQVCEMYLSLLQKSLSDKNKSRIQTDFIDDCFEELFKPYTVCDETIKVLMETIEGIKKVKSSDAILSLLGEDYE